MDDKSKALLGAYEEYKREIKELEAKCDELKPQLLEIIPRDAKIDTGIGTFTVTARKKWKYSDELTEREKEVKEDKKVEEQTGVATASEGEAYIIYKSKD